MNIYIEKIILPLKEKFKISHSEYDSLEHILVRMEHQEIKAYGEIVPIAFFKEPYPEAYQQAESILKNYRDEIQGVQDVHDVKNFILKLKSEKYFNCILCGFEMVLLDYLGKVNKKMIWELLELEKPYKRKTPLTLPIKDNFTALNESLSNLDLIKLKLGGESDLLYLKFVKENSDKKFILDVNQGWTVEKINQYADYINSDNVLLLEEPIKFENHTALRDTRMSVIAPPLFLDESIKSLDDAMNYMNYIDGVNIKITKFGGLLQSVEAAKVLKSKNIKLMLGCFLESSLSISYAFSISSLFDFIDLDGATFIKTEPFSGVSVQNGEINGCNDGYGIGVRYV